MQQCREEEEDNKQDGGSHRGIIMVVGKGSLPRFEHHGGLRERTLVWKKECSRVGDMMAAGEAPFDNSISELVGMQLPEFHGVARVDIFLAASF